MWLMLGQAPGDPDDARVVGRAVAAPGHAR
jgi:hypothetical protein